MGQRKKKKKKTGVHHIPIIWTSSWLDRAIYGCSMKVRSTFLVASNYNKSESKIKTYSNRKGIHCTALYISTSKGSKANLGDILIRVMSYIIIMFKKEQKKKRVLRSSPVKNDLNLQTQQSMVQISMTLW